MPLGKPYTCMLLFAASACAAGAARPLPTPSTPTPQPLTQSELHALSERHCSACHQSSVSRAKPAALAVFDLDRADWSAHLSAAQFSVFYQRMQGELDAPTRARLGAHLQARGSTGEPESERAAGSETPISAVHPPE